MRPNGSEAAEIQRILKTCETDPRPAFFRGAAGVTFLYIGPESYLRARRDSSLYPEGAYVAADGFLLATLWRALGKPSPTLLTFDFTSQAGEVFSHCEREGLSLGLIGGTDSDCERARAYLLQQYPGLRVSLCRSGYFTDSEMTSVAASVAASDVEVLVVGVGFPRQNLLASFLRRAGFEGAVFTCGAFVSQMARGGRYYPRWVSALHLRWAYRMLHEPYVIWRVLRSYPRGLLLFWYDWVRWRD